MDTSVKKETAGKAFFPKKAVPKAPVVYVGPNMGGDLPMLQFTVYRNGLPRLVKDRFDSDPDFARLFCPSEDLNKARAELKTPGSVKARAFNAVFKKRKGNK